MNYTLIGLIIILIILYSPKRKEKFNNQTNRVCSSIYGSNHPRCVSTNSSKIEHVGYFKINSIKYPVLDLINQFDKIRYLLVKNKFYKFKEKYWNRGHYFKHSFLYNDNIPYSLISEFTYRGMLINSPTKRRLYVFGKKIFASNYKYLLFREKDGILQFSYSIPYRRKILEGDSVFVRNKISTFGPFIFYKNE